MKLKPRLFPPTSSFTVRREAADCLGKEAFASHELANAVATRMRRHRGYSVQIYHCRHCGAWHIGSNAYRRERVR